VAKRKAVGFLITEMGLSERRACRIGAYTAAFMHGCSHKAERARTLPWPGHDRSATFHPGQQLAPKISGRRVDRARHRRKFLPRRVQLIDQGYHDALSIGIES